MPISINPSDIDDSPRSRFFQLIVEHAPACIALLRGPEFIFELVNPAYAAIAPGIVMQGRSVAEVFPDAAMFVVAHLRRVLETGEVFRVEDHPLAISSAPDSPAETRNFSFSYTRVMDGSTADSHSVLVLALETTARKKAEEARELALAEIRQQWRTFDTALSNTPDFVYNFDLDGRLTYVNSALLALWRIPLEAALGKNFFDLEYPVKLAAQLQLQIEQVISTKQRIRDQTPFTGPTGETRHYEYIFVPVLDAAGQVEAVTGSTRDMTEQIIAWEKEAERQDQIRESARLESLGVMAGIIAHDFNNLLTGILGNASLLAEAAEIQDRPLADEIVLAAERAADLTMKMLAYSGKGRFVMEVLELNALVRENLTLVRASLSRRVSVELDLAADSCFIKADRVDMQQLIMNLLINASEAMSNGTGTVSLRTSMTQRGSSQHSRLLHVTVPEGDYVLLEVGDNGCGMSPAVLKNIFDPFFTTKFTGRGLGLAAVLGIVKGHSGEIEVDTEEGTGTLFRIFLPMSKPGEVLSEPRVQPRLNYSAHNTILVVDDEDIVLRTATAALESRGFCVVTARNGVEAVEAVQTRPELSLVILDLTMPLLSGEQALPLIRGLRPDLLILLTSGFDPTEVAHGFNASGITGFLQKPYTVSTLFTKVTEALHSVSSRSSE